MLSSQRTCLGIIVKSSTTKTTVNGTDTIARLVLEANALRRRGAISIENGSNIFWRIRSRRATSPLIQPCGWQCILYSINQADHKPERMAISQDASNSRSVNKLSWAQTKFSVNLYEWSTLTLIPEQVRCKESMRSTATTLNQHNRKDPRTGSWKDRSAALKMHERPPSCAV